jgi:hypothetical protein
MRRSGKVLGAAGGAVGLSGVAAFLGMCCVAPWAVALFGVSGAVMLARLAYWQPYLLLAAFAALACAFWWAYRRPPAEATCDAARGRRLRRWVWVAAIAMAMLALASIAPMFISFV